MPYDQNIPILGIYHQYRCARGFTKATYQNVYGSTI